MERRGHAEAADEAQELTHVRSRITKEHNAEEGTCRCSSTLTWPMDRYTSLMTLELSRGSPFVLVLFFTVFAPVNILVYLQWFFELFKVKGVKCGVVIAIPAFRFRCTGIFAASFAGSSARCIAESALSCVTLRADFGDDRK